MSFTSPHQVLSTVFGYSDFREGQQQVIDACLQGQDTLVLMPTGAGKSLCYQIPALLLDRVTIVVTPLLSCDEGSGRPTSSYGDQCCVCQ